MSCVARATSHNFLSDHELAMSRAPRIAESSAFGLELSSRA